MHLHFDTHGNSKLTLSLSRSMLQALFPLIDGRALVVGDAFEDESKWMLVDGNDGGGPSGLSQIPWLSVCEEKMVNDWEPRRVVGMAKTFDMGIRCNPLRGWAHHCPAHLRTARLIRKGIVRVVSPALPELHPARYAVRHFVSNKKCIAQVMDRVTDTGADGVRQLVRALYTTNPLLMDRSTDYIPPTIHQVFSRKRAAPLLPRSDRAKRELESKRTQLLATAKELVQAESQRAQLTKIMEAFAQTTTELYLAPHRKSVQLKLQEAETRTNSLRDTYESLALSCEELESELNEWQQQKRTSNTNEAIDEAMRIMLNCIVVKNPRDRALSIFKTDDKERIKVEFRRLSMLFHPDKTQALASTTKSYTDEVFRMVLAAKRSLAAEWV